MSLGSPSSADAGRVVRLPALGFALVLAAAPAARAQAPRGWIQSDAWASLVPLQGNDCSGGGVHAMTRSWVAPHDLREESPVAGDVWDDIDFGGAAASDAWRGDGPPAWTAIGPGADADVVDWNEYLVANGLTDDFVMGIAVTYVENTTGEPLPVRVCSSSDDSSLVLLNGRRVTAVTVCRGVAPGCSEIRHAVLAPGTNRITVLVWEGFGGFGFRLALLRPDGTRYTDTDPELRFLGAGGAAGAPPEVPALPRVARSYEGGEYLLPSGEHEVVVRAQGGIDPGATYTVVEEIRGRRVGLQEVSEVSHGGVVEAIPAAPPTPVGAFFDRALVGQNPCGPGSGTTFDGDTYTSVAETGGDIWNDGDRFEFAYSRVEGDFDVSIAFTGRGHSTGQGRWGKFGIMARWTLDANSRFTMVQDHLPDPQDAARLAGRTTHLQGPPTGGMYEDVAAGVGPHPVALRLTRRGSVVEGWASDDPGLTEGVLDPTDDANWVPIGRLDDWGIDAPAIAYVGFANSEHNSNGCAVQTVDFRLLGFEGDVLEEGPPEGVRVRWEVPGDVLEGPGVRYRLSAARGESRSLSGRAGGAVVEGPDEAWFQEAGAGATGPFDGSTDIGEEAPCTPGRLVDEGGGTFTISASGEDIWANGDQFHFAYREVRGDFDARVRLFDFVHAPASSRWGKTGIMARWDARPNAAYYFAHDAGATDFTCAIDGPRDAFRPYSGQDGGNGEVLALWWQDIFGEERIDELICTPPPAYIRSNDLRGDERNLAPWLRMVRRGSTFWSYASDDGEEWRALGSFSWPDAPEGLLVGVAMTSHAGCETQRASFDSFTVEEPAPLLPETPPGAALPELRALEGEVILEASFDGADDFEPPPGWVVHRWGGPLTAGFAPQAVDGRLRLADLRNSVLGSGQDTGTSAFWPEALDADRAWLADFDIFFANDAGVTGEAAPGDGLTFAMLGVEEAERREHGPVEGLEGPGGEAAAFDLRTTVGTARGSGSGTTFDGSSYTTRSATGRDIWADGDSFEYAYTAFTDDFDVAVELLDRRFPLDGRWGKFGLMARQTLEHHAKFAMIQDHGPDLQDAVRFARRSRHRRVATMSETPLDPAAVVDPNDGTALDHPRYLRLTRRGGTVTGWVSNTAGDEDPLVDANWVAVGSDDSWGGVGAVLVGLAYSVHNSSGGGVGEIDWRVVAAEGDPAEPPGFDPVPHHLDVRFGDLGAGLGWGRHHQTQHAGEGVVRSRDVARNSFAIEFDNVHGSQVENDGDGGNVSGWNPSGGELGTGSGPWHVGLDVNGSIYSAQRNHQLGVHDDDLPDIYHPDGVHVTVLYDHGHVRAWVRRGAGRDPGLDAEARLVVDRAIEPVAENAARAVLGFTSGTGATTTTMEVDDLRVVGFGAGDGVAFRRGDTNADGGRNLTDGIFVLQWLFQTGVEPSCLDAADANDDGRLNLTDGVFVLQWLFQSGAPPPEPFADCGTDPTPGDEFDCASFPACP